MIVVTGTLEIAEQDIEAAKAAIGPMVAETLRESGCHCYEFSQVIGAENRFRIYEEWADLASLEAHFATAHMAAFRTALAQIAVLSRSIHRFEAGPREDL